MTRTTIPNPGIHLSSYTVYARPGQRSGSRAVYLCDDCAAKRRANGTMASKWSGECINGYCDDCKTGPSVPHYRLADEETDPAPHTKPATSAAEYEARTRDENKQRELHPDVNGSLSLDTMRALPRPEARQIWAAAADADKRGLAIQCIRHGGHCPDEATVAMYLDILEGQLGPSEVEAAVMGALSRLADSHQRSAEGAETTDERTFFRRWAGAFRKALLNYKRGVRPEQTPLGSWLVESATRSGTVHSVERSGVCSCEAQNRGCWHSALVAGVETGYDDLAAAADDAGGTIPDGTPDDDYSDTAPGPGEPTRAPLDSPLLVASLVATLKAHKGAWLSGPDIIDEDPHDGNPPPPPIYYDRAAQLGRRLAVARACYGVAA